VNPFDIRPAAPASKSELLIDADFLAYMVGSLSQHKIHPGRECEFVLLDETTDTWVYVEPEGLVKWKVRNEIDKLLQKFDTEKFRVFLTGEGNFREKVAVTKPYKGTRQGIRPYYFKYIRDYLESEYDAWVTFGIEADDAVSIEQSRDDAPTIVVSNDKDLKNTPGYLYSSMKDELYYITPKYAEYHFWYQMVVGDRVDNIPGIPGRGQKWFDKLNPSNSLRIVQIIDEYLYKGKSNTDLLYEQGNLLHMLRYGDVAGKWEPTYNHTGNEQGRQDHLHKDHEVITL